MGLAGIEELLQATMGLNAASIGSAAIARAVQTRLPICGAADPEAYLARLRASASELQALIDAVVVPETWFFRDRAAFTALGRLARDQWLPAHPAGVMAVLSLPCSTGEEPYSIAMALLDAGVPADRFRVDAVDISEGNVAQSIRAVYGRNSFRGADLAFRDQYFDATPEGLRVKEAVRRQVRVQQGNIFAAGFLPGDEIYDVVFCRNVLIYFDRPTQDRALAVLNRLLQAQGILFVAPAETALPSSQGLVATSDPTAFAFRKGIALPAAKSKKVLPPAARAPRPPSRPVSPAPSPAAPVTASRPAAALDLEGAARLADQGHFAEAAIACEAHVRQCGPSAPAFYLIGLVRDATGNHNEAVAYYRKALYLDPRHYDAQIQLALLIEKQGDAAGALVLRNRARRLEESEASHE